MLKELRKNKGITSTFVANKLSISRERLKRIEDGKVTLPAEFIPTLAGLYNVSYEKIIDGRVAEWTK